MSKTLKYILFIGIPLVVLLIAGKKMGWFGGEEGLKVELGEAKESTITETVLASGKIQPEVEVKISSEVSGEIVELPVEEGQAVKKGDLLVRINPDIYQAAVSRVEASVKSAQSSKASAEAQFVEAKRNYNRNKTLYEQNVISASEFDAIQRAYDVAQLQVENAKYQLASAQASAKEARDNLSRTTIYAPQNGTISMLNVELGERVVGTAQMTGTEILRIANLESMEVLVDVNENDIIRVNTGDTALIEVDAYLDEEFKGVVTEIANSAKLTGTSVDQVTNFEVKVRIVKESYAKLTQDTGAVRTPFRPGMTASVEIKTEERKNIVAVPIEAVTIRQDTSTEAKSYKIKRGESGEEADEDFEVVFLYTEAGKAELRVVKTGIQDDEQIEIKSGLQPGDQIIKGPYSVVSKTLVNGDRVTADKPVAKKSKD